MSNNTEEKTVIKQVSDRTKLDLGPVDTALIFRSDGKMEMILVSGEDEERNIKDNEFLTMAIAMHLSDKDFVNMIMSQTEKMFDQQGSKKQ